MPVSGSEVDGVGFRPDDTPDATNTAAVDSAAAVSDGGLPAESSSSSDPLSSDSSSHAFGWRDLFDVAVRWRQISEPNDPGESGLGSGIGSGSGSRSASYLNFFS